MPLTHTASPSPHPPWALLMADAPLAATAGLCDVDCHWPAWASAPCGLLNPLRLRLVAGSPVIPESVLLSSLPRSYPAGPSQLCKSNPGTKTNRKEVSSFGEVVPAP